MTPILYEKDEIDFTSQGLGSLVEIYDVDVQEQRNGLLQLTASYPVSGVRYADISVGRIILAKPNQRDDVHAFRIVSTELDISGYAVTIEADSITYDLTHNIVKHLNASGNGQAFMTALKNAVVNPSVFTFYSDIVTTSTTSLHYVNPMEAIMGTTGSFLQIWGGELKRENRRVAMFNRRGRDNVATFRLGKNIAGLKYSVDISSLVTRIIPTKSVQNDDQTTTTLEGTPVDSQYINNYEQIYTLPLEFTDDTIKTVADLNAVAKGWFTQSANTGRDKPTVTIDIDVLSLQDSADYQDKFKNLESVSLTDTVTVYVPEYGVNVTAIVNELHYDPILDRVTKMTVGTAKQSFADSSRTQLSDLQDKIISVQNQADAAAMSANGKSTNYYGSVEPSHPQEGDTWFWVNGDKSGIKVFVNGDWVDLVDSDTQEKIAAAVTDAVTQAKAHTDEVKQVLSTDIATAKSQAASQASTAEANAKSAATSQFTQAQSALSAAKSDLTNSIASEASARNAVVSAANSQAQTYANQAKADAISVASSADSVIRTAISSSADSLSATITQNKSSADSGISTAQTIAKAALDGLEFKVSKTDYDQKTGDLSTKINDVKQTADSSAQTIADIKIADGKQDARMSEIESTASGLKSTVSDLQTTTGKQSGDISTLQQRADGFDATVTKVNNLSVGARNYWSLSNRILGSFIDIDGSVHVSGTGLTSYNPNYFEIVPKNTIIITLFDTDPSAPTNLAGRLVYYDKDKNFLSASGNVPIIKGSYKYVVPNNVAYFRMSLFKYDDIKTKVEIGTIPTDWSPAPEDVDAETAKAQLTADNATTTINSYKIDADNRISKAQSDIIQTAAQVATKVSQTDYDAKTNDLSTKVSTAQQTADGAVTTIGAYKTSNDSRVTSAETKISQNTSDILLRATTSDLNAAKTDYTTKISQVSVKADNISSTVTQLNTKVDSLTVAGRNYWSLSNKIDGQVIFTDGSVVNSASGLTAYNPNYFVVSPGKIIWTTIYETASGNDTTLTGRIVYYDSNKTFLASSGNIPITKGIYKNIAPANAAFFRISLFKYDDIKIKVEVGTLSTDWSPAPEDIESALAQVKITADSISNFVRDSSGNISSDFQTALSKTSIITGSTLATSIQTQTATQIASALTDNNGKIISLINQDTSGVQIAGKNIVLNGDTTVTGDFYAKGGNFKNLNASNLTVGTLNGSQVNITNINASNIVSGAISGANLNINLNTGSVVFQKGRINSSDYTTDINIDQGYISTANDETRALLTQGKLQLIDPTLFSPQTNPYLEISNNSNIFNGWSALIKARDSLTVSINGYDNRGYDLPTYTETFVGLSIGKDGSGLMPTKIGGAEQGVIISGGVKYSTSAVNLTNYPYIYVGSDSKGISPNGDRIYLNGKAVHIPSAYNVTWSASANVYIASDGSLYRASSAKKYKQDIKHNVPLSDSKKLLEIPLSTWIDKRQYREKNDETRYFGMIAEDLRDAGLEYLVQYGDDNEVEGINYDRVALLLIPLVKELKERIEELESKGK